MINRYAVSLLYKRDIDTYNFLGIFRTKSKAEAIGKAILLCSDRLKGWVLASQAVIDIDNEVGNFND